MTWIYKGNSFTDEHIPDNAIGFVYAMSAIINGKSVIYIGKKNFYASTKTKLSKKAMPTDKRLKKYKRVIKTAYQNYYSSNEVLKQAHKDGVRIKREILKICFSNPSELNIDLSLIDEIEKLTYPLLDDIEDWYNDEGGYGSVNINVNNFEYEIENHIQYTSYEDYNHSGNLTDLD